MRIWHSVEEPLDVLISTDDTWQTEYWIRRIVWVNAHIYVILLTDRHDSLEPVLHVFLKLLLVDAIIKLEQIVELLDRSRVALAEVT